MLMSALLATAVKAINANSRHLRPDLSHERVDARAEDVPYDKDGQETRSDRSRSCGR